MDKFFAMKIKIEDHFNLKKMFFHKKLLLLPLLATLLVLNSCNKWLEVNPATQTSENEQFENEQGYIDVLFGIYQKMNTTSSYGGNLSYGLLDILAGRYENKSNVSDWYGQAARYNYVNNYASQYDALSALTNVWKSSYAAIAQTNYLLQNMDKGKKVLSVSAYNMIKGEALGLRGFLHFDLLRLFAPAFLDGENASKPAIPYMREFTVIPQARLTMQEVLTHAIEDLKAAEALLVEDQKIDQIAGNQASTSGDLSRMYRQNHLNYWAIKATLARLYLYMGKKDSALQYARQVIQSEQFHFTTQDKINSEPLSPAADLTFTTEHVFSIYRSDLKKIADEMFKSETASSGDNTDLFSTRAKLDAIYEVGLTGYGTDLRSPAASKSLWSQLSAGVVYTKKFYFDVASNVRGGLIPVIKLSEMYYIAAEAAPTAAEAVSYLNEVRSARLIPELASDITDEQLSSELMKCYRKEFYGEGQLWFYYKRTHTLNIPDGVGNPMDETKYTFPMPQDEIEFGK